MSSKTLKVVDSDGDWVELDVISEEDERYVSITVFQAIHNKPGHFDSCTVDISEDHQVRAIHEALGDWIAQQVGELN